MRTTFAAVLFAVSISVGAAYAHGGGGGGAEPMPGVSFTDMPRFSAKRFIPVKQTKPKPIRWRQGFLRDR